MSLLPEARESRAAASRPALHATDLHFAFDGVPVLKGVDIALESGVVTAIAGPNGAGKSTLLEVIAGVRVPSQGRVARSGSIALVVQRIAAPDALPVTVREVVTMGTWERRRTSRADARRRVTDALERVALDELADRPFTALSGGQRQRVLLAQGIARQAQIFLLDEPASGLDSESRERTQAILAEEAARGAAVACVTHDDAAIAIADRVVRLDGGVRVA
ncbi:zinc ABC transporter ATP-binding protein AztA [Leucobacter sp. USCH14]|uniref:zinc ABC transporter ATP-binding protein AztA n=1 Tax=Leucobacter sp. USCH14 TaxID=3024838 RepID=UPI0030AAB5FD